MSSNQNNQAEENKQVEEEVWQDLPPMIEPVYKIDEKPASLGESILYAWQHTLVDISPFVLPIILGAALGMSGTEQAQFINFCLFSMGIATLIQTTIGNKLPIVQGPSATLTGALTALAKQGVSFSAMWGGIFLGAIIEMLIGASRILKYMKKLFPLTVSGVVIISIGISLGQVAIMWIIGNGTSIPFRGVNFFFAGLVIFMIFFFQLFCSKVFNGILSRGAIFFSIWLVGLGVAGAMGEVNWQIVANKPLFALPQFFPYGGPGFGWELTLVAVVAIFIGYLGSMVESLGDYAATCAVVGEKYQVKHMNRGIFAEGLSCMTASIFGGMPCTSYTQNIGIIATTKVASRYVVQMAAFILLIYGLCPKFGALLVAMPRAVLGGVFVVVCGMIIISGIQLIAAAKNTQATMFMVGTTIVCAVGIPAYIKVLKTSELGLQWFNSLPAVLQLLLSNTVVLAVVFGITLNTCLQFMEKEEATN